MLCLSVKAISLIGGNRIGELQFDFLALIDQRKFAQARNEMIEMNVVDLAE